MIPCNVYSTCACLITIEYSPDVDEADIKEADLKDILKTSRKEFEAQVFDLCDHLSCWVFSKCIHLEFLHFHPDL